MIKVVAKVEVKKGFVEPFVNIASELVDSSREESGNISYELTRVNNTNLFVFIETWTSEKALELHSKTKHFSNAMTSMKDITISSDEEMLVTKVVM